MTQENIELTLQAIVKNTFDEQSKLEKYEKWGIGALNDTYCLWVRGPDQKVFVKIEHEHILPSTRRGQIEREVYSEKLMKAAGIDCPAVLHYDFTRQETGVKYLAAEFVEGELLWEIQNSLSEAEREQIKVDTLVLIEKMNGITSPLFGDIYPGGLIGQFPSWKDAYRKMWQMLMEDAAELKLFSPDQARMVDKTLVCCLERLVSSHRASYSHNDLGLHNLMDAPVNGFHRIGKVIDFGNAQFLPIYWNEDGMRLHGGFGLEPMDVQARYGISKAEYEANSLLGFFDMTIFWALLDQWRGRNPQGTVERFIQECRKVA